MFNRKKYQKQYKKLHKEKIKIQAKQYYQNHKKEYKEYQKNHKIQKAKYQKKYRKTHKKEILNYLKNRRNKNIDFKCLWNIRKRMWYILRNNIKSIRTIELIGCSIKQLRNHLEKQFKPGMSWDNYGRGWNGKGMQEWHIDHIRPCASFDMSKESEQLKCFHYTNLQPLWAEENLIKHCKI